MDTVAHDPVEVAQVLLDMTAGVASLRSLPFRDRRLGWSSGAHVRDRLVGTARRLGRTVPIRSAECQVDRMEPRQAQLAGQEVLA